MVARGQGGARGGQACALGRWGLRGSRGVTWGHVGCEGVELHSPFSVKLGFDTGVLPVSRTVSCVPLQDAAPGGDCARGHGTSALSGKRPKNL